MSYRDIPAWRDVSDAEWHDWTWQMRHRITDCEGLAKILPLTEDETCSIRRCLGRFRMSITPYYASLIDPQNPACPIRQQAVPSAEELVVHPGDMTDPLAEQAFSPVPGIVHRYPDRVLFLLTHKCSMYCRHCTRRRLVGEEDFSISREEIEGAIDYIRRTERVRDVLLSGGDPLVMPDGRLESIIRQLRAIPHVEIIRIGTRTPVVMPMRITDDLVRMLRRYHPIWINTHFNHPAEITSESAAACGRIVDAGIPLGNQSVLLRGVNDDVQTLRALFTGLVKIRVRPYYLYQCDPAMGTGHFRTPVAEGVALMRQIRGYISGFAVPEYVIDAPGGGGKTPVNPDYILSHGGGDVTLRNYEGKIYHYPDPE